MLRYCLSHRENTDLTGFFTEFFLRYYHCKNRAQFFSHNMIEFGKFCSNMNTETFVTSA